MPTYADWSAANGGSTAGPLAPVKLVIDARTDSVIEASIGTEIDEVSYANQHAVANDIRGNTREGRQNHLDEGLDHLGDLSRLAHGSKNSDSVPETTILLVIDTNWLISHLAFFLHMVAFIPITSVVSPVVFILPQIVLRELDGLKSSIAPVENNDSNTAIPTLTLGKLARRAIHFLSVHLDTRPDLVRVQKLPNESRIQGVGVRLLSNDEQIIDCASWWATNKRQTGILSDDLALSAFAKTFNITTLSYEPCDADPTKFLAKLHPDLPAHFETLRAEQVAREDIAMQTSPSAPMTRVPSNDSASVLAMRDLMAALQSKPFPQFPMELLNLLDATVRALLAPPVHAVLFRVLANEQESLYTYILQHESAFSAAQHGSPNGNSGNARLTDCRTWSAYSTLRLLDVHWRDIFRNIADEYASKQRRMEAVSKYGPASFESSPTKSSLSASTSSGSHADSPGGAVGLSASRWAASSAKGGTTSNRVSSAASPRASTSGGIANSPDLTSTRASSVISFSPSKFPSLLASFPANGLSPETVSKWSAPRWSLLLDDLRALLCHTGLVGAEGSELAEQIVRASQKLVDVWRGNATS